MTEAEWNTCTDPQPMLEFLRGKASDRKLRLFACACARLVWNLLPDQRCKDAVRVAERFADGLSSEDERHRTAADVLRSRRRAPDSLAIDAAYCAIAMNSPATHRDASWSMASQAMQAAAVATVQHLAGTTRMHAAAPQRAAQALLLRCIFGAIWPVTVDQSLLARHSGTVPALAAVIYTDRVFDRLPILADALEDAGCTDPDILAHCRGPGPHVRGCWVVDLLTGKE